jgi:hypothetical protein
MEAKTSELLYWYTTKKQSDLNSLLLPINSKLNYPKTQTTLDSSPEERTTHLQIFEPGQNSKYKIIQSIASKTSNARNTFNQTTKQKLQLSATPTKCIIPARLRF